MELFPEQERIINLKPGIIKFWPNAFGQAEADDYYSRLSLGINWKQEDIYIFGKWQKSPRLQAWFAEEGTAYSYSGIKLVPNPFNSDLLKIKSKIEIICKSEFNSCLLNFYRNGNDSMGWHSDDEIELGPDPIIASLSLGAVRKFKLRSRVDRKRKFDLNLVSGSLLLMGKNVQANWQHSVPKSAVVNEGRINLTFRKIIKKS